MLTKNSENKKIPPQGNGLVNDAMMIQSSTMSL